MKIEKQGIRITEVPGVEWIEVDVNAEILIKLPGGNVLHYTPEGLDGLIQALAGARNFAQEMSVPKPATPRTWIVDESIPEDVTTIVDRESDTWYRTKQGWATEPWDGADWAPESYLLSRYGPVTESTR